MEISRDTDKAAHLKHIYGRYWDERSSSFDAEPQHVSQSEAETNAWKNIIARATDGRRGLSVLDVGAGTGFLALLMAEMGHQVTGIDISKGMLAQAREKASKLGLTVTFQEADAERTGFPDAAFDLVVSRHVLWNLPHPDTAIRDWARIIRPAGVVAVIDGIFGAKGDHWGETYREAFQKLPLLGGAPPEKVAALMRATGLSPRAGWLRRLVEIKKRTLPKETADSYSDKRYYMVMGVKPA